MRKIQLDRLSVYFEPPESDAAALIADAARETLDLLATRWSLEAPADLRVYVMTSWRRFLLQAAPWFWQPLIALQIPLLRSRMRRLWPVTGGWAQRFGGRHTVGVKPPWLLARADRSIGDEIFVPAENLRAKVREITCHELTHALTAALKLPAWLNEGLAMVAVDRLQGRPTVRPETLSHLTRTNHRQRPDNYRSLHQVDPAVYVQLYAEGYWVTRYLDETHPQALAELLAQRRRPEEFDATLAEVLALPKPAGDLWQTLKPVVVAHYAAAAPEAA